jgi:hypothetical protein
VVRPGLLLVSLSVLVACGEAEAPVAPTSVVPPPAPEEIEPEPGTPPSVTDAEGALLESDVVVSGLTLPRGLEVVTDEDRRHVYRTRSTIDQVVAYLGPRLSTAEVTRADRGEVTYGAARPTGATSGPRMDVSISPTSGRWTRLEIVLEPETALGEPSEEEVRRRLETLLTSGE